MSKGRKAIVIVALILAVIMVTGRFLRQDERYLHAGHVVQASTSSPTLC